MKKIETIWHHLLQGALKHRRFKYTQQEIANHLGYSLSTVNHALKIPTQLGAIRKATKFFVIQDLKKLLYYWASMRQLNKDIIYQTSVDLSIIELERSIPGESIYAGYSAARHWLKEPPADYSKVYIYLDPASFKQVQKRFPLLRNTEPNFIILKTTLAMKQYGRVTTIPQTFVDIWNLKDWYAKAFTSKLEEKIDDLLS